MLIFNVVKLNKCCNSFMYNDKLLASSHKIINIVLCDDKILANM